MFKHNKAVWGWALYDWGNSAFATTVMAGFFPIFFKQYWSSGADVNMSSAQLGLANSVASLLVALMAPVLGAIADRGSYKKRFMTLFAYLGVLMTACLFLVEQGNWLMAVLVYTLGTIGFSGANVFYDSLLPSLSNEETVDSVSSLGYAMGYLGGGILFLLNVVMTLNPSWFGLADAAEAVRWSFLTVALWWGCFTLLTLFWVPEPQLARDHVRGNSIAEGLAQLRRTFKEMRHLKTLMLFLFAYWFYMDGVDTIVRMAVDYGMSIGFASTDLITALLLVQFVGFPAALIFGRLGEKWGVKRSIFLAIGIYMLATIGGMQMTQKYEFYLLAAVIGLVQGGIQALSRSYYSRLIPPNQAAEYYGFFNMLGKFAVILGPVLMGGVALLARNWLMPEAPSEAEIQMVGQLAARWSIGSILILFLIGGILLYFVDDEKGREEARYLVQH